MFQNESQVEAVIFVDTQIVTCFNFLSEPDSFLPAGCASGTYVFTLPTVRELEKIKDSGMNSHQQKRARDLLKELEKCVRIQSIRIRDTGSSLFFAYGKDSDSRHPDDAFVQTLTSLAYGSSFRRLCVLSDDVGVRVRVNHALRYKKVDEGGRVIDAGANAEPYAPNVERLAKDPTERLPVAVKAIIKQLAVEVAAILREEEEYNDSD